MFITRGKNIQFEAGFAYELYAYRIKKCVINY